MYKYVHVTWIKNVSIRYAEQIVSKKLHKHTYIPNFLDNISVPIVEQCK